MAFLAHTENVQGVYHRLDDHLREVGRLAALFGENCHPELTHLSEWAGKLHDLGKYLDEFQEYLIGNRNGGPETHHAVYGAALAYELRCIPLAYSIAGHHAGLHDRESLKTLIRKPEYRVQEKLATLKNRFEKEIERIPNNFDCPAYASNDRYKMEVLTRFIFSSLVDADFLDTETHYNAAPRPVLPSLKPDELLHRLDEARISKARKAGEHKITELRNQIYQECLNAAKRPQGIFSLTVPTGGGKTLSGMAFALRHALEHKLRRIIVVIPYLSIIEQNASEYRSILDPNNLGIVIENHSAVVDRSEQNEETSITESKYRSPSVLASENWDAPIVITTSVQFIETLFSNRPSRCRKLHNIARSVVLFDEVQTIPTHLLEPILSFYRELRDTYGVSFVFSSATQPAFKKQYNLTQGFEDGEICEIVSNPEHYFKSLRRVKYEFPEPQQTKSWKDIALEMVERQQALCVVNTRRQAFELWDLIKQLQSSDEGLFHLSSAMCAEHRLNVIDNIRSRLAQGLSCIVVSTQLVEAGVDLDFPFLLRAMGPLDSIVQAAGRCNREDRMINDSGTKTYGLVKVFIPQEHKLPPGVYKTATQQTASLLQTITEEELTTNPTVFHKYFNSLYGLVTTDYAKAGETTIQQDREQFDYRKVASKVKVIDDNSVAVVVPYDKALTIVEEIRQRPRLRDIPQFTRNDLRRLQRFMVNVRRNDFAQLEHMGQVTKLLPFSKAELYVLNEGSYDKNLGVLIDRRPTDENIL